MEQLGIKIWKWMEKIAKVVIFWLFSLFKIEITNAQWDGFMQFVKFGIVGLSNTAISYFVYVIFVAVGIHYVIGSIIGFAISVLNSFYWNNKYVFRQNESENRNIWKALVKTFMSYAVSGLILANILLFIWVDVFGISEYLGPIINLFITIPLNFIMNKLWAFKTEK